jgi:hypothetical protein
VATVARRLFAGVPAMAAIGPLGRLETLDRIRARIA